MLVWANKLTEVKGECHGNDRLISDRLFSTRFQQVFRYTRSRDSHSDASIIVHRKAPAADVCAQTPPDTAIKISFKSLPPRLCMREVSSEGCLSIMIL